MRYSVKAEAEMARKAFVDPYVKQWDRYTSWLIHLYWTYYLYIFKLGGTVR